MVFRHVHINVVSYKYFNEFCNGKAWSARLDRGGISRDARAIGLALAIA